MRTTYRIWGALVLVLALGLSAAPGAAADDPPEETPPVLTNFSASPNTLGYEGGQVTLSIDVEDEDGIGGVGATVYLADGGALDVPMAAATRAKEGPTTFSGVVDIPPNYTDGAVGHSVEVSASDDLGAGVLELVGWIDVDGQPQFDEPPAVSDPSVTPQDLSNAGGTVTIEATATDNSSVSEVVAEITDPGGGQTQLQLDPISSSRFSGSWSAPENQNSDPQVYSVLITAYDDAGLSAQIEGGQITVQGIVEPGGDNPPIINSVTVTPTDLPADGGAATITVDAIDDYGIFMAYADVTATAGSGESVQLLPGGGSTYSGTINLAPNETLDDLVYGVNVTVTDTGGGTDSEVGDAITVAGQSPPVFSKLALSMRKVKFGRVTRGTKVFRTLELENVGETATVAGVIPAPGGRFRLVGSHGTQIAFDLAPGEILGITLAYRSAKAGLHRGALAIQRDDTRQPRLAAKLKGVSLQHR